MRRNTIKSRSASGGTCEDESECWGGDGKTVLHPSVSQLRFKLRFSLILTELHQHDDNEALSCQYF